MLKTLLMIAGLCQVCDLLPFKLKSSRGSRDKHLIGNGDKNQNVNAIHQDKTPDVNTRSGFVNLAIPHHCAQVGNISCPDPNYCMELIMCECQTGWTGAYCATPCTLPCEHGVCRVDQDLDSPDVQITYCNCEPGWQGKLCQLKIGR